MKRRIRILRFGGRCIAAAALGCILPAAAPAQSPAAVRARAGLRSTPSAKAPAAKRPAAPKAASAGPPAYVETLPGSVVKLNMVGIPGGALLMAGKSVPVKPFWIADTETTWEAFDAFIASGPSSPAYDQTDFAPDAIARPSKSYILPDLGWGHHGYPAINISFLNATMFCRWLAKETGKKYRLPTEAEWEYACRAGAPGPVKLTKPQADKQAWYAANSDKKTQPVGKKAPNAWKLYDMFGNVGEWATDGAGKPVLCGPTFNEPVSQLISTERKRWSPAWQADDPQLPKSRWWLSNGFFVGFRVVREP